MQNYGNFDAVYNRFSPAVFALTFEVPEVRIMPESITPMTFFSSYVPKMTAPKRQKATATMETILRPVGEAIRSLLVISNSTGGRWPLCS